MAGLEAPSLEQFVTQRLQSSTYQSYEAMVQAGLRLLQGREAELDRIADKLRPAAEQFTRGEPGIPFDAEDIIRRGKTHFGAEHGRACPGDESLIHLRRAIWTRSSVTLPNISFLPSSAKSVNSETGVHY